MQQGGRAVYKSEWKKTGVSFEPKVSISTLKHGQYCLIMIQDNGSGIKMEFRHRIFEPFFTTKPTGEGVGLGLSISNDIVAAHGGKITLETEPGEFSRFVIALPL